MVLSFVFPDKNVAVTSFFSYAWYMSGLRQHLKNPTALDAICVVSAVDAMLYESRIVYQYHDIMFADSNTINITFNICYFSYSKWKPVH
jgi:hypothetical protein